MFKIAICDDNHVCRSFIMRGVNKFFIKENYKYTCEAFENGEILLKTCEMESYNYDIIFLDIIMNQLTGLETAKILKAKNPNCEIVFITGFKEYVFESFDVNPFAYLVKPIDEEMIFKQLEKLIKKIGVYKGNKKLLVVKNKESNLINPKDIIYVDANSKFLTIHCTYDEITFRGKISEIEKQLNEISNFKFIKTHRSFIVNPFFIQKIGNLKITLTTNTIIPISRLKSKEIKAIIANILAQAI